MLLKALQTSLAEFEERVYGIDTRQFDADFSKIWNQFFNGSYEKGEDLYKTLLDKPYCVLSKPAIRQATMLIETRLLSEVKKDFAQALQVGKEALGITDKDLQDATGNIILENIAIKTYTLAEYRLLFQIAVATDRTGDASTASSIYQALVDALDDESKNYNIRKKLLPAMFANLSSHLFKQERYDELYHYSKRGLAFCADVNEHKAEGCLLNFHAIALQESGRPTEALPLFKKPCAVFAHRGDLKRYQQVKDGVRERYNIDLS